MNLESTKCEMPDYPLETNLKDETQIVIRPMEEEDLEGLIGFFSKMPLSELLIYANEIKKRETLEIWYKNSEGRKIFQMIALHNNEIIAKGALYREGLYLRRVVELKLIVNPDYRGKGLGSQMFRILLIEALKHDFRMVIIQSEPEDKNFTRILDRYGFKPETVFRSGISSRENGERKELVTSSYNLEDWQGRFELYSPVHDGK